MNVVYKQQSKTPLLKKSGKKSNMNVHHDPSVPSASGEGSTPAREQMIKTLEQGRYIEDFSEQVKKHQAKIGANMP